MWSRYMASRMKSADPPPIEIKSLTLEEINRGVTKLKRRIADVTLLATENVRHDDQRRRKIERRVSITIMENFGQTSPEYGTKQHHTIWHGEMVVRGFGEEPDYQGDFLNGIPQTSTMLNGLITRLEEKRADLGYDSTAR